MKLIRVACLVSLGGLLDNMATTHASRPHVLEWFSAFAVFGLTWFWTSLGLAALRLRDRTIRWITGRPQVIPATDPKALAAEIAALNLQISQLRETATSFDMSFDDTLERLDSRLRRVEQQTPYINIGTQR